jgi:hypothetical protein
MNAATFSNERARIADMIPCENILVTVRSGMVVLIKSRKKVDSIQCHADWDGQSIGQRVPFKEFVCFIQREK